MTASIKEALEPHPGLRPCPFCGEKRIFFNPPDKSIGFKGSINCPACGAEMPREVNNDQELIDCWNTRATPASLESGEARERIARAQGYADRIRWLIDNKLGSLEFVLELHRDAGSIMEAIDDLVATGCTPDEASIRAALEATNQLLIDVMHDPSADILERAAKQFDRNIDALSRPADAILATGCVSDEAAIRADEREKQKERDAKVAESYQRLSCSHDGEVTAGLIAAAIWAGRGEG